MEKSEEVLEKLKMAVDGSQDYLESKNLASEYVTNNVCPPLREALKILCIPIEEHHKVDEAESEKDNIVIHYTSISALVSMLRGASKESEYKDKERETENKKHESDIMLDDKKSLWRLYDSVHLNDPDEGNYFARNLNLPKKYDWLKKEDVSHAYIASFILPNSDSREDMSDNLVFWRTYGREGEGCSLSLPIPRHRLQKVLYGTKGVKSAVGILRPALDFLLDSLEPLVRIREQPLRKNVREILAGVVWESLERFRYLYKSEAYRYEKECRFVIAESDIINKNKIFFEDENLNNSPIRIRHYYEHENLDIRELLATGSSITLGPRVPHANNVCYFLNTLRERAGLVAQEIKISKIPYRKF